MCCTGSYASDISWHRHSCIHRPLLYAQTSSVFSGTNTLFCVHSPVGNVRVGVSQNAGASSSVIPRLLHSSDTGVPFVSRRCVVLRCRISKHTRSKCSFTRGVTTLTDLPLVSTLSGTGVMQGAFCPFPSFFFTPKRGRF